MLAACFFSEVLMCCLSVDCLEIRRTGERVQDNCAYFFASFFDCDHLDALKKFGSAQYRSAALLAVGPAGVLLNGICNCDQARCPVAAQPRKPLPQRTLAVASKGRCAPISSLLVQTISGSFQPQLADDLTATRILREQHKAGNRSSTFGSYGLPSLP